MKIYFASFILLLLLASATFFVATADTDVTPQETSRAQAEQPAPGHAKIMLVAPTSVRIGELVRLDVSESSAEEFKWILVPDSVDFLVYDSGKRAVFSAREAGEFQIIVGCAVENTLDIVTHTIKVTGPPAQPTSDSFVELIPYWMWNADLPTEECTRLAVSFEAIAARYSDLPEQGDWIKATAEANREVLGERVDAWAPILEKIGKELLKKAQAGELMTPEDHKRVWMEVAEGLRAC